MDGTTDVAGDEQENLYLRCCIAGEVINKYITTSMPLSATSEGVYQCLINEVKQNDIDMNKLVGFGSDEAAIMMGIRNGVGTRLKEICPDITLIHCLAHRLELCFKDAIKKSQYYDKAQTLLIGLYYFIRKSRWIGHQVRAVAAFLKSFQAIVDYLSNHSNASPKAEGLVKLATSAQVVVLLLTLQDIFAPLASLSLFLQRRDATIGDAQQLIAITQDTLKLIAPKVNSKVHAIEETGKFCDRALTRSNNISTAFRQQVITEINTSMDQRFDVKRGILSAASISCFQK